MSKNNNISQVERSSNGLRIALFEELDALRSGKSTPARANATSKLASVVVETVRLEIDAHKALGAMGSEKVAEAVTRPLPSISFGA